MLTKRQRQALSYVRGMLRVRGYKKVVECKSPIRYTHQVMAMESPLGHEDCWVSMAPPDEATINVKYIDDVITQVPENVRVLIVVVEKITGPAMAILKRGLYQGYEVQIFTYEECQIPWECMESHYLQPISVRLATKEESKTHKPEEVQQLAKESPPCRYFGFKPGQIVVVEDSSRVAGITVQTYATI